MIQVLLSILFAGAIAAAIGALLDRGLQLFAGSPPPLRWALRLWTPLVGAYVALLSSWAALGLAVGLVALRLWRRTAAPPVSGVRPTGSAADARTPADRTRQQVGLLLASYAIVATLLAFSRPMLPIYWDESVWVTKAVVEARGGWGALRSAALRPGTELFPAGYPLLWSLAPAWLTRFIPNAGETLRPLMVGFTALKLLCTATFLATCAGAAQSLAARPHTWIVPSSPSRPLSVADAGASARPGHSGASGPLLIAGLAVAGAPLMVVHARAVYADLSVGLLAATVALLLFRRRGSASDSDGTALAAGVVAAALTGFKDEGVGHVIAVTAAVLISPPGLSSAIVARGERRRARVTAAALLFVTLTLFVGWRALLALHGIRGEDHAWTWPRAATAPLLLRMLLSDAAELRTWGLLWPAVGLLLLVFAVRRVALAASAALRGLSETAPLPAAPPTATPFFARVLLLQLAVLLGALLVSPERVQEFVRSGTVMNRLLVQLAPVAFLLCWSGLTDLTARRPLRSAVPEPE